jgi:hypothetical protein
MKEMATDTCAGHAPGPCTRTWLAGVLMLAATGGCLWQDDGTGAQPSSSVVLEPNTIRGSVRFTNTNPEILALLDSDPRRTAQVFATSTSPTGYSASTPRLATANLRGFDFEMSVEAAAGGPAGIQYRLEPKWIRPLTSISYDRIYDEVDLVHAPITAALALGAQAHTRIVDPLDVGAGRAFAVGGLVRGHARDGQRREVGRAAAALVADDDAAVGQADLVHGVARDAAGNATPALCEVTVPHDQSGSPAADSGTVYSVCR